MMKSLEIGDCVFFGPFVGHVDRSIKVPPGEEGLLFMRDFLRKNYRPRKLGDPSFAGGFVGFVSYDLGAKWMGMEHDPVCPDAHFVYIDKVFAFQEESHPQLFPAVASSPNLSVNLTKDEYTSKIARIKEFLNAGETYQVNFSQKFQAPYRGDAFELYQKITAINPSPYRFFMEADDFAVISNSPERLFRITLRQAQRDRIIETRPMKGTMPRGKTEEEDIQNIHKLLASEKERAELAMIVDLERNDLGKLCETGTVEVNEDRVVEKYSHVIHTVSNVRGILAQQYDWYDALRAMHPGGSITGAPKKRTMEIIQELEGESRGAYCGCAGYIDLSGECDFNIMIRTLWLDKKKNGGILTFRSGGGIVVDSDPQKEYEETLHKAAAFFTAIYASPRHPQVSMSN